jgi:hypothetical protein
MRQSLANAAARGTSHASIAAQKRELLEAGDIEGLLALNRSVYGQSVMVAEDDADDDPDDDDTTGDADDEDDDEDSDDEEDKGSKKPDARSRRIQELAAESKKHRLKARDYRRERDEALAELEKLKQGKGKPDEDDKSDDEASSKLEAENEELKTRLFAQQLRSEFNDLTSGSDAVAKFKNPKTAFRLLDLDDVEVDDDGSIEGLEDAIKALAKSDPYLLDTGKDDEDDDEDEVSARRKRRSGQPTGGKSSKANPNRDKLVSKYPALRR